MRNLKDIIDSLIVKTSIIGIGLICLFTALHTEASYIYEANQSLHDLQTNSTGSTGLGSNDDAVSGAFNIGFTFDFYGQSFTQARMATNGCLHFKTSGAYCNDYTPDPLPEVTYTLYPFWTDLIKDNGSAMRAKAFDDYTIFGWYNMREYNRANSDNSFEVWLYPNDTFEFRYGALDIINHDVLIGEQGSASQTYTYLFHDECSTGTTNVAGTCVNTNWNGTASNTLLENGGSLYGEGSGNAIDCSDPLNDVSCSGYAAAYLTQQCGLDSLHSTSCPLYWEAYDDQQCDEDPQYAPFCAGYTQEASVAFFDDTNVDYGYEEEVYYGYEDDDPYEGMDFTDEEWYEIDIEEFGQEQVDEWYGTDVVFNDDGMVDWDSTLHNEYDNIDILMDEWDIQQNEIYIVEEFYLEPVGTEYRNEFIEVFDVEELIELYEFETIIREEIENEIANEEMETEEFETLEDLEEWFEETMDEIQEDDEVFEITESREELLAEAEAESEEENSLEEESIEELFAEEDESKPESERRSSVRVSALSVVAGTLRTASSSVSNYSYTNSTSNSVSGSSYSGGGSSSSSGSTALYGASGNTSGGGMSTSNSPSVSEQFNSATTQTNQVLSMSGGEVGGSTTFSITPMPTLDDSPQVVMADVQVQDMQGEINTAVSGVMTASEADQVADQIIANNIKEQQQDAEQQQEETGEYADSTTLVAYLGYVQGFDSYRDAQIPQQETWYEPRAIYADAMLNDNTQAFYGLAGESFNTLGNMINMQPDLKDGVF